MEKKNWLLTLTLTLVSTFAMANDSTTNLSQGGLFSVSIGSLVAVFLSWKRNKSILWAILHFLFGWFYVIYYFLSGGSKK